jgi:Family of unknown function (DUF6502)
MSTKEEVATAAMSVFAPLVRLFVDMGLTCDDAERLLRRVYVREARQQELRRSGGKRVSDARLAMICGIPRKSVSEILKQPEFEARATRHRASWLLHIWRADKRYCGADGTPRALAFDDGAKGEPTFMELASTHAANVWPKTLLAELLRTKAVREDGDGKLHLNKDPYAAPATKVSALRELADCARRLQGTLVHNLTATIARKRAVRTVSGESIPASRAKLLRRQFQENIDALTRTLEANVHVDDSTDNSETEEPRVRIGVTVFLFEESLSDRSERDVCVGAA